MKDNFSAQASSYAQFRPVYPGALYDFLLNLVGKKNTAWDCGCGNGQVSVILSDYFKHVIATDISTNQVLHAVQKPNISYRVLPAEKTNIESGSIDLITSAQAVHWFNFDEFYNEVKRVATPEAILALWCYNLPEINPGLDDVIAYLYNDVLGNMYWDPERKLIEKNYATIPFPFDEITSPVFQIETCWRLEQLIGYLNSWSAVQHFIKQNKTNPVSQLEHRLRTVWGNKKTINVSFPVYTRIAKVNSKSV